MFRLRLYYTFFHLSIGLEQNVSNFYKIFLNTYHTCFLEWLWPLGPQPHHTTSGLGPKGPDHFHALYRMGISCPPYFYANYKVGPTPPIKTKDGWLEIIHGVYLENRELCYSIGAILLDLEDPSKIISVLDHWILTPTEEYELRGRADNTVFACGAIADEENDSIKIYYGAADECIGLAEGN